MEQKPTVLVTHCDVPQVAIDLMKDRVNLIFNEEKPTPSYAHIKAKVKGVEGILFFGLNKIDQEMIDAAGPQLKVIASMGVGVDMIDVDYLKSKRIKLANSPGFGNDPIANVAIMLALAASRRILEGRQAILEGAWNFGPKWLLGPDITRSTVGIVGLGDIGQTVAKRLKAFDVGDILYTGRKEKSEGEMLGAKFVDLDTLLRRSDFVFVTCTLTEQTAGMFNKAAFNKMKNTSVFVNISRGQMVVQEDLIEALKSNVIFAAGLDVMTPEPLPKDHELLSLQNCVLSTHIGSATVEARNGAALLTAKNILRGISGEELLTPVF